MKYSQQSSHRFRIILVFACSFVLVMLGTTISGTHPLLGGLFGDNSAAAKVVPPKQSGRVQTLAILQAAVNADPNPNKSTETVPVDDGEILVADMISADSANSTVVNTQISTYVVRAGDTYSGIAKMFGVSVNTILWANNIVKGSPLKVGQTLVILPVTGLRYTVKKGDTVASIVNKYKADLQEVLTYNDLTASATLSAGQIVLIPDVEVPTLVPVKIVAGNNPAHDTNGPDLGNYYIRPIRQGVRTQGLHGYNGVDLAAPRGTPIYAAAAGTVIASISNGAWNGGYGNYVIISHGNGTQTLYAHNSKNLVRVGDNVTQGQQIALMGATGHATGSHVHFEVRGAKNPCGDLTGAMCKPW